MPHSIAVLDDYQDVAESCAEWSQIPDSPRIVFFREQFRSERELVSALVDFDIVVLMRERTPLPASVLGRLPKLKLIVTTGAGNAAIDIAAARESGMTVCATGSTTGATAELTWGLILTAARRLDAEIASVRAGGWQLGLGTTLHGSVLGVIGLGRQGAQVARIGVAFGMRVLAWSPNLEPRRARDLGVEAVTRAELLQQCDFVTIHVPLDEASRGSIGEPELRLMKPSAWLVNTSRGPIVEETALLASLRSNAIAGYAVDVYDVEPPAVDHPFRTMHNVIPTPHLGYVTRQMYEKWFGDVVEDIVAFLSGVPVRILA